jgi:hypothetical protein
MRMAGIKLHSLKMTATADKYIAVFQVLADTMGYNKAALIDFFQHGLTTPLAKLIYTCSGGPPTDLQGWKDTASTTDCFECAWAQDNHEVKQNRTKILHMLHIHLLQPSSSRAAHRSDRIGLGLKF